MSVREIIEEALREGRSKLHEHEAMAVLREYGLPVPEVALARSRDEAVEAAARIGFPVVLKIVSPSIVHKSDVGGVVLGLETEEQVAEAYDRILANVEKHAPGAEVVGVLVQRMVPKGLEVIVGATRDPIFDAVVMFGLGGIFVEVLRDVSFRVTPVSREEAYEMLGEIKASRLLDGYRGMPPRDKEALADIIVKVSRLMDEVKEIKELDMNPIMSYEKGAAVADARIIVGGRS